MDDLRDLFDLPDAEEEDEEAYDTVGGFIVHREGRIPLPGTVVPFGDVTLTVEVSEPRRVAKIIASRPKPPEDEDANGGRTESEGR
jgi:CBS domain containing-hemolysin-like protein